MRAGGQRSPQKLVRASHRAAACLTADSGFTQECWPTFFGAPQGAVVHELIALDAALRPAELEEGSHRSVADAAPESDHAAVPAHHRVECPGRQTRYRCGAGRRLSQGGGDEGRLPTSDWAWGQVSTGLEVGQSIDRRQMTPVRVGCAPWRCRWRHAVLPCAAGGVTHCKKAAGISGSVPSLWFKPSSRTCLVKLSFADGSP